LRLNIGVHEAEKLSLETIVGFVEYSEELRFASWSRQQAYGVEAVRSAPRTSEAFMKLMLKASEVLPFPFRIKRLACIANCRRTARFPHPSGAELHESLNEQTRLQFLAEVAAFCL
jgi:hypothetical protein